MFLSKAYILSKVSQKGCCNTCHKGAHQPTTMAQETAKHKINTSVLLMKRVNLGYTYFPSLKKKGEVPGVVRGIQSPWHMLPGLKSGLLQSIIFLLRRVAYHFYTNIKPQTKAKLVYHVYGLNKGKQHNIILLYTMTHTHCEISISSCTFNSSGTQTTVKLVFFTSIPVFTRIFQVIH